MVEADYRMKLVGMGLEQGVPGVKSYLASVVIPPGEKPPALGVLRWWFTLNYDALGTAQDRQAFAVRGQGVKVESENERLSAEGQQIHTGESDALNRKFAHSFTEHFPELCQKYPIYAELRNLFDLALVCALVQEEGLAERVGWHMTCFGNPQSFAVELGEAPKEVDTVINYRIVNRVHIVAGVSGGVRVHPAALVDRQAIQIDRQGGLSKEPPAPCRPSRAAATGGGIDTMLYRISDWFAVCALVAILGESRLPAQEAPTRDNKDAVAANVGDDPIYAAEVGRMLAKATGGKPVNAAAQPFIRAEVLEEIISRRLVLAYARRSGTAASPAELDSAGRVAGQAKVAAPLAGRFSPGPVGHSGRPAAATCLELGVGEIPGPIRHRRAAGGIFSGASTRVGRQPGFGEPDSAAACARRRAGSGRVAREAGRRHPPAGDRGRDFIRRGGRKILGRGQHGSRAVGWARSTGMALWTRHFRGPHSPWKSARSASRCGRRRACI